MANCAMAVPKYEVFMLPLLRQLSDGKEHHYREVWEGAARELRITPEDRLLLLPSGKFPVWDNRCGWARTYLKKAGLIESPRRGHLRITQRGQELLASGVASIDSKYLERFPEFVTFKHQSRQSAQGQGGGESANAEFERTDTQQTPEEALEHAYGRLRATMEAELLDKVREAPPDFFERLVVELLVAMGYGGSRADAGQAIGRSGDEGIDGIIKEDRLGLDAIYLQAKRWSATVGRPEIQKFAGALQGHRARKGVFITTSEFSREAEEYVSRIDSKIVLIDGTKLAQLMFEHDVGVTKVGTYDLKRIDGDYFEGE